MESGNHSLFSCYSVSNGLEWPARTHSNTQTVTIVGKSLNDLLNGWKVENLKLVPMRHNAEINADPQSVTRYIGQCQCVWLLPKLLLLQIFPLCFMGYHCFYCALRSYRNADSVSILLFTIWSAVSTTRIAALRVAIDSQRYRYTQRYV